MDKMLWVSDQLLLMIIILYFIGTTQMNFYINKPPTSGSCSLLVGGKNIK